MITGRPVLATKVGVIGELLTDNKNIFFTKQEPNAIAGKMKFIIENNILANKIGHNGRLFALQNFDYSFHTVKMINYFGSL